MPIRLTNFAKQFAVRDREENHSWGVLQVFNGYRVALAFALLVSSNFNFAYFRLGTQNRALFVVVVGLYLLAGIACLGAAHFRRPLFRLQVIIGIFVDITALTLILHASHDGIGTVGVLMNAAIAGGSVLMVGRMSIFFAALASLCILIEHASAVLWHDYSIVNYTQIGLVGITFFATAILGFTLSLRIRNSEALAEQRRIDLAQLEKINNYIVKQIRAGIIVVDEQNEIGLINDAACNLLSLDVNKEYGVLNDVSPELNYQLSLSRKTAQTKTYSFRGNKHSAEITAQFIPLGETRKIGTVILLEDTARIAQQAQQLKLASLGSLTASIAHEIRNPLAAISNAAQLLEESTALTSEEQRLIEIISQQAIRMNNVIKNVLQLSRRAPQQFTCFPLKSWLQNFVLDYQHNTTEQCKINVELLFENQIVQMDSTQLQQVLVNLFDNGLRYSKKNKNVALLTLRGGVDALTQHLFIEIVDGGPGVAPENIQHLFEPFYTTERQGTGLGLYIAHELCQANRAELRYVSFPNEGGCFRITFQQVVD